MESCLSSLQVLFDPLLRGTSEIYRKIVASWISLALHMNFLTPFPLMVAFDEENQTTSCHFCSQMDKI